MKQKKLKKQLLKRKLQQNSFLLHDLKTALNERFFYPQYPQTQKPATNKSFVFYIFIGIRTQTIIRRTANHGFFKTRTITKKH